MNKGFVYILRSIKNGKFYIGSTVDIRGRFHKHEIGAVMATKGIRPLRLEFFQEYANIDLARRIEKRLKSFKRRDFIEKIIRDGVIKLGQ